mgnify:FL=1
MAFTEDMNDDQLAKLKYGLYLWAMKNPTKRSTTFDKKYGQGSFSDYQRRVQARADAVAAGKKERSSQAYREAQYKLMESLKG